VSLPDPIFEVAPQSEQNVVGIKDVPGEGSLAGAAKIGTGYGVIFVKNAVAAQQLKTYARIQQSFEWVAFEAQLGSEGRDIVWLLLEKIEDAEGYGSEHGLRPAKGFDELDNG